MATYVKEATRGRTLHLLKLDTGFGDTSVYLDATNRIKEALKHDRDNGYREGGPMTGHEIEKAREYADYVGAHAISENLHQFACCGYFLFTDKTKPQPKSKGQGKKANVRSNAPA